MFVAFLATAAVFFWALFLFVAVRNAKLSEDLAREKDRASNLTLMNEEANSRADAWRIKCNGAVRDRDLWIERAGHSKAEYDAILSRIKSVFEEA